MLRAERVEIANKINFSLAHLLDIDENYVTEILSSAIKSLGAYGHQSLGVEGAGLRGTIFWEYGRLIEKQSGAKVSQIEAAAVAKNMDDEVARTLSVATPEEKGKVGLGGWLAVFIVNVSMWTLSRCLGPLSILAIFATGDYNSNADTSSLIMVGLLSLPPLAIFSLGAWLLVLMAKRRKLAIKIGKIFSAITLGLPWIFYLHDSKRVRNTLIE